MKNNKHEQPSKLARIKEKSRDKLVNKFGPRMEINLHCDSRERLLEIASWINQDNYYHLTRGQTNIFRKTINDLINMFYIDNFYIPKSKESKVLKKIYEKYHDLKFNSKLSIMKIKKSLSAEFPTPQDIEKKDLTLKDIAWKNKHIECLQDYRWVIQTMEKLDGISREDVKNASEKK